MFRPQDCYTIGDMISRLWMFTMFIIVFRDIHEMATASTIQGVLKGTYEGNPVTDAGLVVGGIVLTLMLLTGLFSTLLKPYAARRLNLVVVPFAFGGTFYLFPNDPDDYLLGGVTAVTLLIIFIKCWFWQTTDKQDSMSEMRNAA